jgi:hypothetical protein
VVPTQISGFAQNRNAFALQLLMALAAVLVAAQGAGRRIALMAVLLAALYLCGSRSAWIALPFVMCVAYYMRAVDGRELLAGIGAGLLLVAVVIVLRLDFGAASYSAIAQSVPQILPTAEATKERWFSMVSGLQMFYEHPILGAGLGAFRQQMAMSSVSTNGIPLIIHSTGIWLLAETGIVGFLIFAVPAVCLLLAEVRRRDPDTAAKLIILCLGAFGVMSGPADMLYQRAFWLIMGGAIAVPYTVHRLGKIS